MGVRPLLEAVLDGWDRNNTILVNLLRALPDGVMELRAAEGGGTMTIGRMFNHVYLTRLSFVAENAPEFAVPIPGKTERNERDRETLATRLNVSATAVRDAVVGRLEEGRAMDVHYDHPILFLQHMIWHEGYHHGQIKLVLKLAGRPLSDDEVGRVTWGVFMDKTQA
jgi:uncharacterized damage-inducible protein DinB